MMTGELCMCMGPGGAAQGCAWGTAAVCDSWCCMRADCMSNISLLTCTRGAPACGLTAMTAVAAAGVGPVS